MQEKRNFVRIEWPVIIQYKTLEEPYTEDHIRGKDISEGGVSFILYERLAKGTRLDLEIQVPFDSMPIFVKGDVAWIRQVSEEHAKTFEVGITFIDVDEKDQRRLKVYIENEIKERRSRSE
ncbi:MAG: PilZ domain-containing protein [Candidatus Omnitrophica bacterium]|nr:PilZ domain-containing protein [Candidatus Omnitrophota bacterium]